MFTDDSLWKSQRRFSLYHLRNLGFGKKSLEVVMREEVNELISEITELKGEPFYIQVIFDSEHYEFYEYPSNKMKKKVIIFYLCDN